MQCIKYKNMNIIGYNDVWFFVDKAAEVSTPIDSYFLYFQKIMVY